MYKYEGFRGFFKGNGISMVKIVPFSAAEFFFYDVFKSKLFPGLEKHELSNVQKLIAGGLTGALALGIVYPTDVIKTYMSVNTEGANKKPMTIGKQTRILVKTHGIRGLYKGLLVSQAGIAPFIGIKLATFDMLKENFSPDNNSPYAVYHNLFLGMTAGTIAMYMTYPLDLTRRLIQLNG
jgi:solute carrier family 25 phosphate transporter 23/24/25/41